MEHIKRIGDDLNADIFPIITTGGLVLPGLTASVIETPGMEKNHDKRQRKSRPTTRSGDGSPKWQRPTNRNGKTCDTTQIIVRDIKEIYDSQIDSLTTAYPGAKFLWRDDGFWLITKSSLISNFSEIVVFITAIPYSRELPPRSWGFWNSISWIGPRHTNFSDGSICAFDPKDMTWVPGNSLLTLLDIYTLWAFRHLYLKKYGLWPGKQSVQITYERILEFHPDEYCGCNCNPARLYKNCCLKKDQAVNQIAAAIEFTKITHGGIRQPPEFLYDYFQGKQNLPKVSIINQIKSYL